MGVFQTSGECICGMLFHLPEWPFDCVLSELNEFKQAHVAAFLYIKQRTSYCSINTVSVHVFGATATAATEHS